jgi:hypothetical protein
MFRPITPLREHVSKHYQKVAYSSFRLGDLGCTKMAVLAMEAVDGHLVKDADLATYATAMDRLEPELGVLLMWLFANRTLREQGVRAGLPFPKP